ncbi:phage tail protein [Lonsdalea britannica]|uniref:phage tail sheath subtilisin-like domain-containing protein n=1 Tax=Lonsdalea britannica TaxID=1082704 RepID=UPI000A1DCA9C|nr:phage tail sheath subtilisin-like domain-containing protein [Lonsdalea britannica]OSN07200.1 phage tail protein [Lonsdalea britannica]
MSETYHHGVKTTETTQLSTLIRDIDTSTIGVVCIADDADAEAFPLNTPVLVTRASSVLGKAGTKGTLYTTLKAISDQASPKIIVIRVQDASTYEKVEGETAPTQEQLIIGGTGADGRYTGMFALLSAAASTGETPRVLAVPGLDSAPVAAQLGVIAEKLRAFAYISAFGCKTIAEAKTYRATFAQRELMVIWPEFIAYNSNTAKNETIPATAYAIGLRAKIDAEQGWHKTLSNVVVNNVLGISADVYWSLQGTDTDADDLNSKGITTLIKRDGFRFWGSRTCDAETYTFESYTRTAQILADMIAEAHFGYIDKPLTPSLVKDIVDGINRKGVSLVTANRLLGFSCWYDKSDNATGDLRDGKLRIRYKYTPVPPLEQLGLTQEFTDEYFAVFDQLSA